MKITLIFSFLVYSSIIFGQSFSPARHNGGYEVVQVELTTETLNVSGIIHQVYRGKYGKYIATKNRHNKIYPRWIGESTTETYNGYPIRKLLTGKLFYLTLDSKQEIIFNYLKKN
jgi:hypothetical protein